MSDIVATNLGYYLTRRDYIDLLTWYKTMCALSHDDEEVNELKRRFPDFDFCTYGELAKIWSLEKSAKLQNAFQTVCMLKNKFFVFKDMKTYEIIDKIHSECGRIQVVPAKISDGFGTDLETLIENSYRRSPMYGCGGSIGLDHQAMLFSIYTGGARLDSVLQSRMNVANGNLVRDLFFSKMVNESEDKEFIDYIKVLVKNLKNQKESGSWNLLQDPGTIKTLSILRLNFYERRFKEETGKNL